MKKLDCDIVAWHKRAFPDATLGSQLLKLEEEIREVTEAKSRGDTDHANKEMADVYIVSVVLDKRFDSVIGRYFLWLTNAHPIPRLKELVEYKMEINKSRNWICKDGVYRHADR